MTGGSNKNRSSGRSNAAGAPSRPAAIQAIGLLGKWTRLTQGHMSLGMGCSCGMGTVNIQVRDYEVQILDYLHGKYSRTGAQSLLRLLHDHAGYRPGSAGSIAALLRTIAETAPSTAAESPTALLDDLERSIDSFDEVHRS